MAVDPRVQQNEQSGRRPPVGGTPLEMRERQRIVDRLRDGPGQVLANLTMELRSLLYVLDTEGQDIRPMLEDMLQELEAGLSDLQAIVEELYPPMTFRELGLVAWLQEIAERYEKQYPLQVRVEAPENTTSLPPEVENIFYRVTQEALRNVIQHANATSITIAIRQTPDSWRLEISDDGQGVDLDALADRYMELNVKETFGLTLMQQLAEAVGGSLSLLRRSPSGTIVRLEVPRAREMGGGQQYNGSG